MVASALVLAATMAVALIVGVTQLPKSVLHTPAPLWSRNNVALNITYSARPPPPADSLLCLVMIVKNEGDNIQRVLLSAKDFIDYYVILDTGSTDDTVAIINQTMEGVPGFVAQEPFVDFATSRNRVIDIANLSAVYILMMSGSEYLHNGDSLRFYLNLQRNNPNLSGFRIPISTGSDAYESVRIHRADSAWRYAGRTHEVMLHPLGTDSELMEDCNALIEHEFDNSPLERAKKLYRWKLDKEILLYGPKKQQNIDF
eukprot:TRINITY_DN4740_c0_g1_i2.p1 TRINITY_DN4740_c0_g1~~TRINITY_DN4740_c0_g1_i2.p1  ORF type:complete len:257 (-),score=55.22 TRINITY_DN4740_c0_g1_i2:50-820(-)